MNRRTLLTMSAVAIGSATLPKLRLTQALAATQADDFPELTITVNDDGYVISEGLTAGRYAAIVVNAGTTPSHSSLGRLPDGVTNDQVISDMSEESEDLPDWFLNAGYVGLPDWGAPGETRTGVIDLAAGNYFMFDPFSDRHAFVSVGEGDDMAPDPEADAEVEMTEMHFILPEDGLPTGPARLQISNIGAIAHEFHLLTVPEGTTTDQLMALMDSPEDATPTPGNALQEALFNYAPVAATSILGAGLTSWIDVDLNSGTYAVMCVLPFSSSGMPHAMEGMMEIVSLG